VSIDKALENLKSVRLKGGIFGKTTMLLSVLVVGVSAVCLKGGAMWLAPTLMLPLMGIVFYALKRSFDFATANPQAAIMDGAEFLQHEKIIHAAKGHESLPSLNPVIDHPVPKISHDEVIAQDIPPEKMLSNSVEEK
jgi:hypothetical protein